MTGEVLSYINRYSNKEKVTEFNASASRLSVLALAAPLSPRE